MGRLGRKDMNPRKGYIVEKINELAVSEQGIQDRTMVIRVECLTMCWLRSP